MERITDPNATLESAALALCGGNPGAIQVVGNLMATAQEIDPMNLLGPLGVLLNMDSFDIHDDKIWILAKEVCDMDVVKVHAAIRAAQMGIMSHEDLHAAINGEKKLDMDNIVEQVQKKLPGFAVGYFDEVDADAQQDYTDEGPAGLAGGPG